MGCEIWKKFCFKFPKKNKVAKKMCGPLQQRVGHGKTRIGPLSPFRPFIGFYIEVASFSLRYFPRGPRAHHSPRPRTHPKSSSKAYQSVFLSTAVLCSITSANPGWCWKGPIPHWSSELKIAFKYLTGPSNTTQGQAESEFISQRSFPSLFHLLTAFRFWLFGLKKKLW